MKVPVNMLKDASDNKRVNFTISFWLSFFVVLTFVVRAAVLPAIFVLSPSDIPPLKQAQYFSGTIDFKSAGPRLGSYLEPISK